MGCQCGCAKCSSEFMKDTQDKLLSKEEIDRVAKEMIALGAVQVNITGGEPTLAKNLFEVIESFQPHKCVITMNTNWSIRTQAITTMANASVSFSFQSLVISPTRTAVFTILLPMPYHS